MDKNWSGHCMSSWACKFQSVVCYGLQRLWLLLLMVLDQEGCQLSHRVLKGIAAYMCWLVSHFLPRRCQLSMDWGCLFTNVHLQLQCCLPLFHHAINLYCVKVQLRHIWGCWFFLFSYAVDSLSWPTLVDNFLFWSAVRDHVDASSIPSSQVHISR